MPQIIAIPAFSDNYIWIIREGNHAVVVDPGDAAPVLEWLSGTHVALTAILATHHHADHVGGILTLLKRYSVPVYGPAGEAIPGRVHALVEGDAFQVPGLDVRLAVLDVPGHTAGHIAYTGDVDGPVLFCGDTLFAGGCGRLFEGTPAQMWASLDKLAALAPDTRVYCAHEYTVANLRFALAVEPANVALVQRARLEQDKRARALPTLPSTIALERTTNPFLRARVPAVRAAAERHAGHALPQEPAAVFAAVRGWKDGFRG